MREPFFKNQSNSFVFRPGVSIVETWQGDILIHSRQSFRIKKAPEDLKKALYLLKKGVSINQLASSIGGKAEHLVCALHRKGLLRSKFISHYDGSYAEKQVLYFAEFAKDPNVAQERIENARVGVVGCGGTGTVVLQHLVAAGFRHLKIVDFDVVKSDNLNRQLCFGDRNIGQSKIEVAAAYLRRQRHDLDLELCHDRIDSEEKMVEIFSDYEPNIVICCADQPLGYIHHYHARFTAMTGIPTIFGAVGVHSGSVGPILTEAAEAQAYEAYLTRFLEAVVPGSVETVAPSIAWTNSLISVLIIADVIRWVAGHEPPLSHGQIVDVNFSDLGRSFTRYTA